jgi:hypothetical protein
MLWVIVQVNTHNRVSVKRTRRYSYLVALWSTNLTHLLLKNLVLYYSTNYYFQVSSLPLLSFYKKYFMESYWKRPVLKITKDKGPYVNNLVISTLYWARCSLLLLLSNKLPVPTWTSIRLTTRSLLFTSSISYLLFAFKYKPFNTLIIYFITWVLHIYYPYQINFNLPYGFIIHNRILEGFKLWDLDYSRIFHI